MVTQDPPFDISVIIPTQNRADSLSLTLECLASANRDGVRAEIIVVDNAGSDNTKEVVASFSQRLSVRYLYEPTLGVFGKSHALNRALDAGGLGGIIAVLDDDMSPDPNWLQGVMKICKRWPDKDLFTGHTYIIWPSEDVPEWAKRGKIHSKLFSAGYLGDSDSELEEGRWYLGGHFWFRSRVLQMGKRFKDIWVTEPDFQLDLAELGFSGVASRDAIAGHRIQPALLQKDVALSRARKTGACLAWLNLQPYRRKVKQARLLHEHPLLGRLFCLLTHWRWRLLYLISYLYPSDGSCFEHRWIATERMTLYLELLRVANRLGDYSLWKQAPKMARNGSPV
jgi:glycosyltransferase involved in cell wall biosynthesis